MIRRVYRRLAAAKHDAYQPDGAARPAGMCRAPVLRCVHMVMISREEQWP